MCGGTAADTAARLGIGHNTVLKHQARGLSAAQADILAQRLGVHPCELWPDWWDHADDPLPRPRHPTVEPCPEPWQAWLTCVLCGGHLDLVAEGVPTDGARRIAAAVVCVNGHRSTLTVTLEAA